MIDHNELLKQMIVLLRQLVDNAKKLKEQAISAIDENVFEQFQEKQDLLMHEIVELDKLIQQTEPNSESTALQLEIEKNLTEFQEINESFVEQLHHRLSLIEEPPER